MDTVLDRKQARCATQPTEVMYPDDDDVAGVETAKQICRACPIREACLDHSIAAYEKFGVWGGMTYPERNRLLRRRRRQSITTPGQLQLAVL